MESGDDSEESFVVVDPDPIITEDELQRITEEQKREQDELDKQINILEGQTQALDDQLARTGESQAPKKNPYLTEAAAKILRDQYGVEVVETPDTGDCLFITFQRFLKENNIDMSVQDVRQAIVNHITKIETADDDSQIGPWRETYEDIILATDDTGKQRYTSMEDYQMQMLKVGVTRPRATFGDEPEIQAFREINWGDMKKTFKVQVLRWGGNPLSIAEVQPFLKADIKRTNALTIFLSKLHYQSLKLITEGPGQPVAVAITSRERELIERIQKHLKTLDERIKMWQTKADEQKKKYKTCTTARKEQCKKMYSRYTAFMKDLKRKQYIIETTNSSLLKKLGDQEGQKGGDNIYINKCKNHRHKKTRKFRIKLKNIDNWTHVDKPRKKHTRRKH